MYISSNPAQRLSAYKQAAAKKTAKHPDFPETWQSIRRWNKPTILRSGALKTSTDKKIIWLIDLDQGPFINEGDANQIIRMDHKSWYTDNDQMDTLTPSVVSVRHAHKLNEDGAHRVYMPACYHSDWDSTHVYREFYDSKEEAARAADQYAEREAEQCREDDVKFQAEQEIIWLKGELHALNKTTLQLIRDVRKSSDLPDSICSLIKSTILGAVQNRTVIFEQIKALKYSSL